MNKFGVGLICPFDKKKLEHYGSDYRCNFCHRLYPINESVVCMLESDDIFYEGAYNNHVRFVPKSEKLWHIFPLWLINSGFEWAVRKHVPAGSIVLELGCAGGVKYFGKRFKMIGCDLSVTALKRLDSYATRVQADVSKCIPLPNASVDAVVSSFFWEHISPDVKPEILNECIRVLKPEGVIVFLYDVETENPLIRWYKNKNPEFYSKFFLEVDGHIGYQTPSHNISLFKKAGFDVVEYYGLEKTPIQGASVYKKLEQFYGSRFLKLLSIICSGQFFYLWTFLTRLIDISICPLLPAHWSRIDRVVLRKNIK